MRNTQSDHNIISHLHELTLEDLRSKWAQAWGREPHARIGRSMLERSLAYKWCELNLSQDQQRRLDQFIKQYKRNPRCFDEYKTTLKPGTRIVRNWNGKRYSVIVLKNGDYEYNSKIYSSLSQIATDITGTRWNGWVFFGIKKREGPGS